MAFKNDNVQVAEYVYDFDVDGGLQAAFNLHAKDGKAVVPVGAIKTAVTMKVLTTFTSGGAGTLTWGNGDDADGYSGAAIALGSLTAGAVFNGWDNAAALLWDDTNDHAIYVNVADAADGQLIATIGGADMTAGKAVVMVHYLMPATL